MPATDSSLDTSLGAFREVHIIGVCGTLMGAFAAYLKRAGMKVTGSDQNIYPPMSDVLAREGVRVFSGYSASNLSGLDRSQSIVVVGNVIRKDNPEAQAAMSGGWQTTSLPEFLEKYVLTKTRNVIVAGTHGKTTTSSLLSYVLFREGRDFSYFMGGVTPDLPQSFHIGRLAPGDCFILEGDEYDTVFWDKVPKFNHYRPCDVILTSIEYDHADIYSDFAAVVRAFEGLIDRVQKGGRIIACLNDEAVERVIARAKVPVHHYGSVRREGSYYPDRLRMRGEALEFSVCKDGKELDELSLRIPGEHNVLNALATWIEARELGVSQRVVREALGEFRGVRRRQEVRGEVGGILVIDDFAHHPTAVRETLRALKMKYPNRKLTAVFEPRSATSRRRVFQKDYAEAFGLADRVYIHRPYDQSQIAVENQFSSEELVQDLSTRGVDSQVLAEVDSGVQQVAQGALRGDVIAVLSNGGFGGFIGKLLKALKVKAAGGGGSSLGSEDRGQFR